MILGNRSVLFEVARIEEEMKLRWLAFLCLLFLVGCGSNGGGGNVGGNLLPGIPGKWTINSTSMEGHLNSILHVNLTDEGNGNFDAPQVVLCYFNPNLTCYGSFTGNGSVAIQGTVTAQGNLSMVVTSSPQGATGCSATYTGKLASGSMNATYTGCSDAGTMTATASPSVTGNYTAQLTSGLNPGLLPFGISASLMEASDHSLTGAASITSSPCFASLTFGPPSVAVGDSVYLQDATHGVTVITPLGSPTNPLAIFVGYSVSLTQYCGADYGTGTLTKRQG
jgi:hypothetical protein